MKKLICTLLLAALVSGCSSTGGTAGLRGSEYRMKNSGITLAFMKDDDRIAGRAVNRFNASYSVEGNGRIRFSPMASTMMMGLPDKMKEEVQFFKDMAKVEEYRTQGDTLILVTSDGKELVFEKTASK